MSPRKPVSAERAAASALSLAMIWAGVIPAQGPASMQRATRPATCGEAIDVPEIDLNLPLFHVDVMHTPGAAITWSASGAPGTAKLEKSAATSSLSLLVQLAAPEKRPPAWPSKSAMA